MKNFPASKLLMYLLLLITTLQACKKEKTDQPQVQPISKLESLTTNVFIYDSVITNWNQPTVTIQYVRNRPGNLQNWSNARVKFYRDGTFDEILTTGIWRQGNWSMNADSSILLTSGAGYSNSAKIEFLSTEKLTWVDGSLRGAMVAKK